jgi:sugar lactone lactonase YvrE
MVFSVPGQYHEQQRIHMRKLPVTIRRHVVCSPKSVVYTLGTAAFIALSAITATAAAGTLITIAGGYIGDSGPAAQARINNPHRVAVDSAGNIYVVDTYNQRIRKILASGGTITTVAGNGISAFAGDEGPALAASLNEAKGLAIDRDGNILIADTFNQRIRKVAGGAISTIAGTGDLGMGSYNGDNIQATSATLNMPYGVTVAETGEIYIADSKNNRIRMIDGTGTIHTLAGGSTASYGGDGGPAAAAYLNMPTDVVLDNAGNIYIADTGNNRIRKILASNGKIATIAGNGTAGYSGDGEPATAASLNGPYGVAVDGEGNVYIADTYNNAVRKIDEATGNISTVAGSYYGFAGDGGPASAAALRWPTGVALDSAENLYIADQFNDCIRKVTPAGIISTVAGSPIDAFYGDNGPAAAAGLNYAHGVGASPSGTAYIADTKNNRIRMVTAAGMIVTVAGNGIQGSVGDGGPAVSASLNNPYGVTADGNGNVYIADSYNHRIRKVDASGIISTVAGNGTQGSDGDNGPATAAQLNGPRNLAVDRNGNLFIADTDNNLVRKVTYPTGTITTIAGTGSPSYGGDDGPAVSAGLNMPTGVAVDGSGNVYIADAGNNRIRKISTSGTITTVAGTGIYGFSGDGGPATSARLAHPFGVAVDLSGTVYVADFYNSRVRKIVDGVITTVPRFQRRQRPDSRGRRILDSQ